MIIRLVLLIFGLFHALNGLTMLIFPEFWAATVVHLNAATHLEFHFIADIGMASLASAAGMIWGSQKGSTFAPWAFAGATWPALHALIHAHEWLTMGVPATTTDILSEGVGVLFVGFTGITLAWIRQRKEIAI